MPLPHLRKAIKGETGELNIPAPSVLISISSGESPSRGEAFFENPPGSRPCVPGVN